MRRRHLIVFTRPPRYGRGKRRLAADIGDLAALRFQQAMLARTLRRLGRDLRWQIWLFVTPEPKRWPRGIPRRLQSRGDLGRRMEQALRGLPAGPRVLIGSDIPGVERRHIAGAFRALGAADAVFGPAADGGYWLVGLRHAGAAPGLFDAVRWSTRHALADTLANLQQGRYALVDRLADVDDGPAHAGWRASAPLGHP